MISKRGAECFSEFVKGSHFEKSNLVKTMILDTEKFVINTLEKGDRNKAMAKLRVPPLSGLELKKHSTTFISGFMTGLAIAMVIVVILAGNISEVL